MTVRKKEASFSTTSCRDTGLKSLPAFSTCLMKVKSVSTCLHRPANLAFLEKNQDRSDYQLVWAGEEIVGGWTHGKLCPELPTWPLRCLCADVCAWASAVSLPRSLPARRWMQQLLYEPLSFQQGHSSKEKQLPSGSATGWGEGRSHYLWFVNPTVNSPEGCGTSKWGRLSLGTKLPCCRSVLWPELRAQSSPARKPAACVAARLNLTLETANTCFLKKSIFSPSATSFRLCCAALVLAAPAAARMTHSKLYLFSALLNVETCLALHQGARAAGDNREGWKALSHGHKKTLMT